MFQRALALWFYFSLTASFVSADLAPGPDDSYSANPCIGKQEGSACSTSSTPVGRCFWFHPATGVEPFRQMQMYGRDPSCQQINLTNGQMMVRCIACATAPEVDYSQYQYPNSK